MLPNWYKEQLPNRFHFINEENFLYRIKIVSPWEQKVGRSTLVNIYMAKLNLSNDDASWNTATQNVAIN